MKRAGKTLSVTLRVALAAVIVAVLANRLNRSAVATEFQVRPVSVPAGCVYAVGVAPARQFLTLNDMRGETLLRALQIGGPKGPLGATGTLSLRSGAGPSEIEWTGSVTVRQGLRLIRELLGSNAGNWPLWVGGVGMLFCAYGLAIVRWRTVLSVQGLLLPWRRVFTIFYIGHFFNSFMLGATGGDLAKALYTARETRRKKTEAVTSILIDRSIGLVGIVLMAVVFMACRWRFFVMHPALHLPAAFVLAVFVGLALGLILVFRRNLFEHRPFFRRMEERYAFGSILKRVYEACFLYRHRVRLLAWLLLLSLGVHTFTILACVLFGAGLSVQLSIPDYFTLFPFINAIAAIPITPGGLGLREGMAVRMLGVASVPSIQAVPLTLLLYGGILALSLFGGCVFLFHSAGEGRGLKGELRELRREADR